MKAVVFAYHEVGTCSLETLLELGVDVVALITHEDDPGEEVWFRTPRTVAEAAGIPVFSPENPNDPALVERLREMEPDFLFSFYYRHILGKDLLALASRGSFNLHGSLLPRYRGRAPINWVLVHGETETGMTLHEMVPRADAGAIVAQERVAIDPEDTARTLAERMVEAGVRLLRKVWPDLAGGKAPRMRQEEAEATTFPGRRPEDGVISWNQPASRIFNLVRAVTHPYPGAFSFLRGRRWFLWWARPEEGKLPPGVIQNKKGKFLVGTGRGVLDILRCQWEGEAECEGAVFADRAGLQDGEMFSEDLNV